MIKKLFFGLTIFIIFNIVTVYAILFTKPGNDFVATFIEDTANGNNSGANLVVNDFTLTTSEINFDATINEKSFIKVYGGIELLTKTFDLKYEVNVQDLSTLKNITRKQFNGEFKTYGTVIGDASLTEVKGKLSAAGGSGDYDIQLVEFNPSSIIVNAENLKIDELLYIINQPKYAKGNFAISANIKSTDPKNLDGIVKTTITKGIVTNSLVNKAFDLKLKDKLIFNGKTTTNLKGIQAITKASVNTTLANVQIQNAVYDISKLKLNSDYKVIVPSFAKLYDLSQTKMRGKATINGNIEQSSEILKVTGVSNILGGALNYELLNNTLKANVKDIEVKQATYMMYYPQIFDSKANLNLDYDLVSKKGKVTGNLLNGHFLPNEFSTLLNTLAQFDLTKEIYETVDVNSDINEKIIKSVINMKSKNTQIDVTDSTLDLNKSTIDAHIDTKIKTYKIGIKVSGDMTSPKVKFDTGDLLKSKAKEEIGNLIDKNIKDEGTKEILNNFKSFFK